jgi:leucyl/phenylalanyl-tRNA--protein transferase
VTELTPEIILQAYRAGIFPMAPSRDSAEIGWYDPHERGILPIAGLHVPKKLRRTIKKQPYRITFDRAFEDVMRGCADVRPDTWINDEIIALYTALHKQGHAHSVEAWHEGKLVGGVYGIAMGGAFFGESMFSTATDASKIALVYLVARLWRQGFELFDTQFINEHIKQFGVYEIPRREYHRRLKKALAKEVSFYGDQRSSSSSSGLGAVAAPGGAGASAGATAGTGVVAEGAAALPLTGGAPSGAFSDEKSCDLTDEVGAFLQSITQTS